MFYKYLSSLWLLYFIFYISFLLLLFLFHFFLFFPCRGLKLSFLFCFIRACTSGVWISMVLFCDLLYRLYHMFLKPSLISFLLSFSSLLLIWVPLTFASLFLPLVFCENRFFGIFMEQLGITMIRLP